MTERIDSDVSEQPASSPDVTIRPDRYRVSALPPGARHARYFDLDVTAVGDGRWEVWWSGIRIAADGTFDGDISADVDRFTALRYSLDDALAVAVRLAPTLTVNGVTVAEVLRRDHP